MKNGEEGKRKSLTKNNGGVINLITGYCITSFMIYYMPGTKDSLSQNNINKIKIKINKNKKVKQFTLIPSLSHYL